MLTRLVNSLSPTIRAAKRLLALAVIYLEREAAYELGRQMNTIKSRRQDEKNDYNRGDDYVFELIIGHRTACTRRHICGKVDTWDCAPEVKGTTAYSTPTDQYNEDYDPTTLLKTGRRAQTFAFSVLECFIVSRKGCGSC